jgi:hypothetical protein
MEDDHASHNTLGPAAICPGAGISSVGGPHRVAGERSVRAWLFVSRADLWQRHGSDTLRKYGNNPLWNNASYYVYQNNPNRYRNANSGNTDFGYATIPQPVNPDSATNESDQPNDGRMYLYNFTGGAGPVYENPAGTTDLHCFPC